MADYNKSFDFDQGSLGRNLALLPDKIQDFIDRDIDVHAVEGEKTMKVRAPWKDRTGHARTTLWADTNKTPERKQITMGHGAEYGVYLEESNNGRFQIVMPTLVATAHSFMRSLEHMFAQLETHTTVTPAITPGVGTRPGTSQDTRHRLTGEKLTPSTQERVGGRFADQGRGYSKAAKAAKAAAKKLEATNKRRRERYAHRKAEGTLPTRRTKRTGRG